jgi:hypothetical protein
MAIVASEFVHQGAIETAIAKASAALAPDVVRIRYSLGEDWTGSGAGFFRVVLSDNASRRNRLRDIAKRVKATLFAEVQPDELGLQTYFNFRSVSEQNQLREPAWA